MWPGSSTKSRRSWSESSGKRWASSRANTVGSRFAASCSTRRRATSLLQRGGRPPRCRVIAAPCQRLGKPIKLDGSLADWPKRVRALEVRSLDQVVLGRPAVEDTYTLSQQIARGSRFWKGAEDLRATVRTAWDDAHLYVGVEVSDRTLLNDFLKNPYLGDSIEMFLDTRGAGGGLGAAVYGNGVYHLRFVPPVGGAGVPVAGAGVIVGCGTAVGVDVGVAVGICVGGSVGSKVGALVGRARPRSHA